MTNIRWALVMALLAGCHGAQGGQITLALKATSDGTMVSGASLGIESAGGNTVPGLKSLRYAFTSIGICPAGASSTSGSASQCLTLYSSHDTSLMDPTLQQVDKARADANYGIDLMDPASRATLNSQLTLGAGDAKTYTTGFINWKRAGKMIAELGSSGAPFLYTHDGTTAAAGAPDANGNQVYTTTATTPLTSGPADEAVFTMPATIGGGVSFTFQQPLTITSDDIAKKTNFVLDLTFNPDGIVTGATAQSMATDFLAIEDGAGNFIFAPTLAISPIAHRDGERLSKETYVATAPDTTPTGAANSFDVRVELFYLTSDPQKAIVGVALASITNAATVIPPRLTPTVRSIQPQPDGSLQFIYGENDNGDVMLTGFVRQSAVGGTSAATAHCNYGFPGSCNIGATVPLTFTLVGVRAL
jgi:hypothetical protein